VATTTPVQFYAFGLSHVSMNSVNYDFMAGLVDWRTSSVTLP
jgi:hypothetical protein